MKQLSKRQLFTKKFFSVVIFSPLIFFTEQTLNLMNLFYIQKDQVSYLVILGRQ